MPGIIVSMSWENADSFKSAKAMGRKSGEKVIAFGDPYPESLNDRVLFYGHTAGPLYFGQQYLTPEAFIKTLIQSRFPFHKVNFIDLQGCETGLIQKGEKSYAQKVAEELVKAGITHIVVRAINSLAVEKDLCAMKTATDGVDGSVEVWGIPVDQSEIYEQKYKPESKRIYDTSLTYQKLIKELISIIPKSFSKTPEAIFIPLDVVDEISDFKKALDLFKEKVKAEAKHNPKLFNYINTKIELFNQVMPDQKQLSDADEISLGARLADEITKLHSLLKAELAELQRQLSSDMGRVSRKYFIKFAEFKDPKAALCSIDKFKLAPDQMKFLADFDSNRWKLWGMVSDRIKEKKEKYAQPRSCLFSRKSESTKLPRLKNLAKLITNPAMPLSEVIDIAINDQVFTYKQVQQLKEMRKRISKEKKGIAP